MRRVVITGIGVVTPIGTGKEAFWKALIAGNSGVGPVRSFDSSVFDVHLGAEVSGFDVADYLGHAVPDETGRASRLALAAARLALDDAGLQPPGREAPGAGIALGTTYGESLLIERYSEMRRAGLADRIPRQLAANYPCNVIPANVAKEFGLRGPCLAVAAACAAGNCAIGYGADSIRFERSDLMLAGGVEAFSRMTYMGFARLGAIAPERCQPFDRNRRGIIPGEGAAVLVLESLDAAQSRGAKIYAEVRGLGLTCDARHLTATHPQAEGGFRAMSLALKESGVAPEEIDYISAHGTGTPANDRMECLAIHRLVGARAASVPVSSIKSMLGHSMGAASAIEAASCALAISEGILPPTINYEEPDPDCAIDCVPNQARSSRPRTVLNNAFAFGGTNTSLCLTKCNT